MENDSLKKIAQVLLAAQSVLVYPHLNMDGDAMGSAVAICRVLRGMGKRCYVLVEDEVARNLQFLDRGYCTRDVDCIKEVDVSLCVDCGELSRFPKRKEKFLEGKTSVCIDHHRTSRPFCDYNYIDPAASATGELIYRLLQEMDFAGDKEVGEALFAAITTDTGNFQYSNTTGDCHRIAAALYDWGIDAAAVSVEIYENVRPERLRLQTAILQTMEVFAGGRAVIAWVSQEMLRKTGATMDESEGVVGTLRGISGVEIAAFVKEDEAARTKVSLRAKSWGNVADIAASLGGGGHIKAAGCTLQLSLAEAMALIREKIEAALAVQAAAVVDKPDAAVSAGGGCREVCGEE